MAQLYNLVEHKEVVGGITTDRTCFGSGAVVDIWRLDVEKMANGRNILKKCPLCEAVDLDVEIQVRILGPKIIE